MRISYAKLTRDLSDTSDSLKPESAKVFLHEHFRVKIIPETRKNDTRTSKMH